MSQKRTILYPYGYNAAENADYYPRLDVKKPDASPDEPGTTTLALVWKQVISSLSRTMPLRKNLLDFTAEEVKKSIPSTFNKWNS